jgi:O-antigen chain-terminating methyltransferase
MTSIDAILEEIARTSEAGLSPGSGQSGVEPKPRPLAGLIGRFPPDFADGRARDERSRQIVPDWGALSALDDARFIDDIYFLTLGRAPEAAAVIDLRDALSTGRLDRLSIALALLGSDEAKGRQVAIGGLSLAGFTAKLHRLPVIGRVLRIVTAAMRLPWHLAVLERRLAEIENRHARTVVDIEQLQAALMPALAEIEKELIELRDVAEEFHLSLEHVVDRVDDAHTRITDTKSVVDAKLGEAKATYQKTLAKTSALKRLWSSTSERGSSLDQGLAQSVAQTLDEHALDDLYLAFENKFRGSPELISARSERYLPMMAATPAVASGGLVLDIGSGRGEWLSLLTQQGHRCRGIDLNVAMVAAAQEHGHDVISGDAIAYLQNQPDNSLGAITGFHIVEHLPFRVLIELLDQAHRTLMPGGAILFETPNPECLIVGACNFYYDPTHQNPLPPELMRFLAEARTFSSARVIRLDQDCDLDKPESGFMPVDVNSWFQMPMDYALYALKA